MRADPPPAPRRLNPLVPPELEAIVLKAIAREPADRYQSGEELAADLHRFLAGEAPLARPLPAWRRARLWARRRPLAAALVVVSAAAAAALLTLGGLYTASLRQELKTRKALEAHLAREAERQRLAWETTDEYWLPLRRQQRADRLGPQQVGDMGLERARASLDAWATQPSPAPEARQSQARAYLLLSWLKAPEDPAGALPTAFRVFRDGAVHCDFAGKVGEQRSLAV